VIVIRVRGELEKGRERVRTKAVDEGKTTVVVIRVRGSRKELP
jgi:hypothetical protein